MKSYMYHLCNNYCYWNYNETKARICHQLSDNYPKCQHKDSPPPPPHYKTNTIKTLKPIKHTYKVY